MTEQLAMPWSPVYARPVMQSVMTTDVFASLDEAEPVPNFVRARAPDAIDFLHGPAQMQVSCPYVLQHGYHAFVVIGQGLRKSGGTLDDAEVVSVAGAIDSIGGDVSIKHGQSVAARLTVLSEQYRDDNAGQDLALTSVVGLHQFLRANPDVLPPSLTVAFGGIIYARWRADATRIFSIYFKSYSELEHVLIRPEQQPSSGRQSPSAIGKHVQIEKLDWVVAPQVPA